MEKRAKGFDKWYEAHMERFIPNYAFFSLVSCFALNCLIYFITQHLMAGAYHYDFTTDFDRSVPFQSWWISIYIVSYGFWIVNYALVSRKCSREFWFRFATADMLARVVCGVIFILLPTTNVRPEIIGTGIFDSLTRLIQFLDAPYNLFPSIHCLASWMCYIGIRGNKDISKGYRVFSLIFALMICASTQFTKQHYIVDLLGGILLAEICLYITKHTKIYTVIMSLFDRLNAVFFEKRENIDEE